jgi:ssRNA-specific RNase YbeY (16S rRNA maturation enzyme)
MINIFTTSRYKVSRHSLSQFAQSLLEKQGLDGHIMNIAFIGKRKMRGLASQYGHGDVAKPVLTFSMKDSVDEGGAPLFGEIIICYPQAVLLAAEKDKSVDAMLEFLVEHGVGNLLKR